MSLLLPIIVLLMIVPLFLSSRKQRRVQTEMQKLQSSLEPGDVVSTTSGLRGTVVDASYEDTIDLEIAEGVVTTWVRAAIREKITADGATDPTEPPLVVDESATAPSLEKTPHTTPQVPTPSTATSLDTADDPELVEARRRDNDSTNGSSTRS